MSKRDLFTIAADLLESEGWCKHRMFGPGGTRCVMGALFKANGGSYPEPEMARLRESIAVESIAMWNDAQRNGDAVIAHLRELAA